MIFESCRECPHCRISSLNITIMRDMTTFTTSYLKHRSKQWIDCNIQSPMSEAGCLIVYSILDLKFL